MLLQRDSGVVFSGPKLIAQSWVSLANAPHILRTQVQHSSKEGTELRAGDLTLGPTEAVTRHFLVYERVEMR